VNTPSGKKAEGRREEGPKGFRVYEEEAKTRRTTHWDWDYLSSEEIDALAEDAGGGGDRGTGRGAFRRFAAWGAVAVGILAVIAGLWFLLRPL
jgi:hypothetical protein